MASKQLLEKFDMEKPVNYNKLSNEKYERTVSNEKIHFKI